MRWFRLRRREQDLERELRTDLELEAEEQRESGVAPDEADHAARRALGNATRIKEDVRGTWRWAAFEQVLRDLRHAARSLRKSPGFTLAAVLTLALGIGANSAIFSIVNGLLIEPLPFPHSDELVDGFSLDPQGHKGYDSQPDLDDWRFSSRSFAGLASWVPQSVNLTGLDQPQRVIGNFVSSNFLPLLGATPVLGRGFAAGEDRIGGNRVAVLSDRLWRSRFGANPGVVGSTVDLNGEPYTIIGVLPTSFVFPFIDADVYLPAFKYPNYSMVRGQASCGVIARLLPGVSIQAAQAEMSTIARRLAATYPASNKGSGILLVPTKDDIVANLRPSVLALAGAVAFVLLIACANIASLLIARTLARSRERAVRLALGASRARMTLHALSEAMLLSLAGGALGVLLAIWSIPAIASAVKAYFPDGIRIELNGPVVLFTIGVSIAAALIMAAVPAWQNANLESLRSTRGAGAGAARNTARGILVGVEVALGFVLLIGAGLMIRSFSELGRTSPGFDAHNLLTLAYRVPRNKYPTGAQQAQFHREVVEKIEAVPGVLAAASVRAVPLGGNGSNADFLLADRPEPPLSQRPQGLLNFADPGFFATMRIPLLEGRMFSEHDQADGPYVLIINRTLARRYFDGRDPIGQRVRIVPLNRIGEIIGVVGDVKQFRLTDPAEPQIYGVLAQNPFIFTSLAVRTAGDPLKMVNAIRRAIWQVDKDQPVWSVNSFDEILSTQSRFRGLVTSMLAAYAGIALLLAAIGIFGVISYSVSQRTAEIGVRMALGAKRTNVALLVLRQALVVTGIGIVGGLGASLWLSRYLRTQLYAVSPLDPGVYVAVAVLLVVVSIAASVIPARRAAKVDPIVALRYE